MLIRYQNKKIEKVCTDHKQAVREYNVLMARQIAFCINAIKYADSVEQLIHEKVRRCHSLTNNRSEQYAMDLIQPYRLIFEKDDENEIRIVKIIEIIDYH